MPRKGSPKRNPRSAGSDTQLRIIGGTHGGRKIRYHGDPRTRPMKDRVREAIFNLLGPDVKGKHAIDLFAGTGALAIEAISRGAVSATAIERHFPTARLVEQNARELGIDDVVSVVSSDTFFWVHRDFDPAKMPTIPWVVFCSPPYDLYVEDQSNLLEIIQRMLDKAPEQSICIVESDQRFSPKLLPWAEQWQWRDYPPARISIRKASSESSR